MPLLLRGSVKFIAVARAILREDGKDPSRDLGPPVYDYWGSWSGTKQLKPLDMSRAPGHGPGYPCLGQGFLGLGPSS
jgi:hypothetical protein